MDRHGFKREGFSCGQYNLVPGSLIGVKLN